MLSRWFIVFGVAQKDISTLLKFSEFVPKLSEPFEPATLFDLTTATHMSVGPQQPPGPGVGLAAQAVDDGSCLEKQRCNWLWVSTSTIETLGRMGCWAMLGMDYHSIP